MLNGSELDQPSALNGSPDLSTVAQAVKMRQPHKNNDRIDFIISTRRKMTLRFQPYLLQFITELGSHENRKKAGPFSFNLHFFIINQVVVELVCLLNCWTQGAQETTQTARCPGLRLRSPMQPCKRLAFPVEQRSRGIRPLRAIRS